MQAILEKFSESNQILITSKIDNSTRKSDENDQCFRGRRAWSEECETLICGPIERRYFAQIRRIEVLEPICDHEAISKYHLLWHLRYYFAKNVAPDYDLYKKVPFGTFDKKTEEYIESLGKVPVRAGGKIAGRYHATIKIKELLKTNESNYKGFKWQVVQNTSLKFLSADCYGDALVMAASPRFLLIGGKNHKKTVCKATADETIELNKQTKELAQEFYFGVE